MATIKRRRIPPIPVESLLDDPRVIAMPAAAFGSLWRLVIHYWLTDCRPLPTSADRLTAIAQAHRPTWAAHKDEVLAVLADYLPLVQRQHAYRQQRLTNLAKMGVKGQSVLSYRAAERRAAKAARQSEGEPLRPRRDARIGRPVETSGFAAGFKE